MLETSCSRAGYPTWAAPTLAAPWPASGDWNASESASLSLRTYLEALLDAVGQLVAEGCDTESILASDRLPQWWTDDRPDQVQANVVRAVEECRGGPRTGSA